MTPRVLHLAKDLTLPLDAVSRTFGILAVRGAGKSNTAAVMAEEMFATHLPFCVIDPVGSWYGLRSSADGTAPGLSIPIFGGKHGDVPLERGAGELLADLVVEKRLTCVLDLSRFESESAKKQFLLAFAQRLYLKNENPLHLFLEEADDYIPQKPMRDEAQLLRAWENIVRRGRARGLGMTLITQRSAAVAKMVLTQVETLFAMRTTGPQDIAAIEAWVKYHQVGKDVLSTLAALEDGEAWVWSPHYLKTMSRHQIRRRETFDSGATPKNVRAADSHPPATLADIDLSALQERMAATIEKAKADDPRELRKQIADLKKQLGSQLAPVSHVPTKERHVEIPVLKDGHIARIERAIERAADNQQKFSQQLGALYGPLRDVCAQILVAIEKTKTHPPTSPPPRSPHARRIEPAPLTPRPSRVASENGNGHIGGGLRRILIALAQRPQGLTLKQIGVRAALSSRSGTFSTYLSRARQAGWIQDGGKGGGSTLTESGLSALGSYDPLPTGEALLQYWLGELGVGASRMLQVIAEAYPKTLTLDEIGEAAHISARSGTFSTYMSRLRTLELIDSGRGWVKASDEFFL